MKSNPLIRLTFAYGPLVMSLVAGLGVCGRILRGDELLHSIDQLIFFGVIIIGSLWTYSYFQNKMALVELTDEGIIKDDVLIEWKTISKIEFTFLRLYQVDCRGKTFFIVPQIISRRFIVDDLSQDRFSRLIKEKKNLYKY